MRLFLFVLLMWCTSYLAACQEQSNIQPTPSNQNPKTNEQSRQTASPTTDQQPATQENKNEMGEFQGKGESSVLTREDTMALLNGRFLLTTFMTQTEGVNVPLATQWKLENVDEAADNVRSFTFTSGDWSLILQEPGPAAAGLLYYAQVEGPNGFSYFAEIHTDGTISPAQ